MVRTIGGHLHHCISASMHLCMSAFLHLFSIRIVDTCCVCPTAGWDSKTPIALLLHSNAMGIMSCLLLRNTTGQKNARCSLPQDRKRCRAESKRAACTFDGQAAGMQAAARLVGGGRPSRNGACSMRAGSEATVTVTRARASAVMQRFTNAVVQPCSRSSKDVPGRD